MKKRQEQFFLWLRYAQKKARKIYDRLGVIKNLVAIYNKVLKPIARILLQVVGIIVYTYEELQMEFALWLLS